jgi:hypothetical protein
MRVQIYIKIAIYKPVEIKTGNKFPNRLVGGIDILLSDRIWVGAGYNFRRADEMIIVSTDEESNHGAGFSCGAGINLNRFKLNLAYGKYHVSSQSIVISTAFQL